MSSRGWWWTGKPGMLQSMGSQRVRHNWTTELNWTDGPNIPGSYEILFFTPSPVTSTTGRCFRFGSISSFFPEVFLYSSPVAFLAPTDLGSSSFKVISFLLFIQFMGFLRQEYWSNLPFPSPVDHVLSEFSPMTHSSWVALHIMAHWVSLSFTVRQDYDPSEQFG